MNNFFGNQLPPEELQRQLSAQQRHPQGQRGNLGMTTATTQAFSDDPISAMSDTPMLGGDSLDDIIRDNSHELSRRRSLPQGYPGQTRQGDEERRVSMMEFPSADDAFKDFQFGNVGASGNQAIANSFHDMGGNLAISTSFSQPNMLAISDANGFSTISPDVMGGLMAFSNLDMEQMSSDPSSMNLFGSHNNGNQFSTNSVDPVSTNFPMEMNPDTVPLSAASTNPSTSLGMDEGDGDMMTAAQGFLPTETSAPTRPPQQSMSLGPFSPSIPPTLLREASNTTAFQSPLSSAQSIATSVSQPSATTLTPATVAASTAPATPLESKPEKNVYSKSGFDMIRALYYVATRPNPEVQLGAVDMSCAFVVCDVTQNDCPIIYVSDNFQNLTGYSRYEIMGQNCRFLQAPDGKVEAGSRREFVENDAVYNLKRKVAEGKEVQQSLINYRKGGKPFLNLLTMIPIPWDQKDEIRFFVGFQIDLVECPDAISGQEMGGVRVNYKHSDIPQYVWNPPSSSNWGPENGQTLGVDDVSTLLQQFNPNGVMSDWHKQSWDKMLLENTDDVVHVLSLKGLFLYLSPSCKKVLEYDTADLVGNSLSSICHPSDIVPVTRELKDTQVGSPVNIVFRIRRKRSGYTWFESHGSLFVDQGKGRKCIILVGRKRPVFALHRRDLDVNGGIGDSELWTKLSTSGMFLYVSSNIRSLLDYYPENMVGTSIQELMRKDSKAEFGRSVEKARRGKIVACKHEVTNRRGQVLQAQTILYPGDAGEGQKPTFLLAQTKLVKASSRAITPATAGGAKPSASATGGSVADDAAPTNASGVGELIPGGGRIAEGANTSIVSSASGGVITLGSQDAALASDDNIFDELKTTRCTSWQYELRQMEKVNRLLAEELGQLLSNKKKRKRRKGVGNVVRDCANCHTRNTPEWRRGPSGQRDLCNSCGLRWAKQTGRVSPRNSSRGGNGDTQSKKSNSPIHLSPLHREFANEGEGANRDVTITASINPADNSGSSASPTGGLRGHAIPPPSQPLLEGGSGVGGSGMGMTSIREEREISG